MTELGGSSWSRSRSLENATVRGRAWFKLLDAPVLTLDVTGGVGSLGRHLGPALSHAGGTYTWSKSFFSIAMFRPTNRGIQARSSTNQWPKEKRFDHAGSLSRDLGPARRGALACGACRSGRDCFICSGRDCLIFMAATVSYALAVTVSYLTVTVLQVVSVAISDQHAVALSLAGG